MPSRNLNHVEIIDLTEDTESTVESTVNFTNSPDFIDLTQEIQLEDNAHYGPVIIDLTEEDLVKYEITVISEATTLSHNQTFEASPATIPLTGRG
ncbi:hypothetical protein CKAH01_10920 [Colletotrichum kahawae]|uniref:Uncharacterized protein n=1 Tax=Colletotrichum kahawae TaxID=34407 RepID=A0AAE0CY59_COLKA|nr:hypothetical protein CKAH01_10920 [Colletotrichum kahawae]